MAVMFIAWIDVATNAIRQKAGSLDRDRTSLEVDVVCKHEPLLCCSAHILLMTAFQKGSSVMSLVVGFVLTQVFDAAARSVSRLVAFCKQLSSLLCHKQCKPSATIAMQTQGANCCQTTAYLCSVPVTGSSTARTLHVAKQAQTCTTTLQYTCSCCLMNSSSACLGLL